MPLMELRGHYKTPCIMCVQYIEGCSVHRGVFSTLGRYHEYIGDIP